MADGLVQQGHRVCTLYESGWVCKPHGLGRLSIYVDDPDGYHIEFTVPFENEAIGRREIEKRGLLREGERRRRDG